VPQPCQHPPADQEDRQLGFRLISSHQLHLVRTLKR
jgi:hypothetical protein